ncbi:hypothetical protein Tsubulata_043591 [Turnera subulata]|uniref:phosphoserine transaminase n=1 Tax=Turnera subulata TaxID=218843 RepID=A0A9Q0F8E0_9ROSI|nr:hypothetical protein Tsubulata_043591 [Turnera subulata]
MEMSHRGKEFLSIIQKAEADLRALLNIPENYEVLFLQGGATTQFAAIPLNLVEPEDTVDYLVTGSWGDKAFKEAQKYSKPMVVWSRKAEKYTKIPFFDGLEQIHAENKSLYNTPPCFGIYMCGLVFDDLLAQGGLEEVERKNKKKADLLYNAIDEKKK